MSHSRRIVGCSTCIWFCFLLVTFRFQEWGLEKGWGDTSEHVLEMIHLLLDILQAPDPSTLEKFLGRIPMIFDVVVVSPHGYFGQANVLGLPDTGGQVNWGCRLWCLTDQSFSRLFTVCISCHEFTLLVSDCLYTGPSSCIREWDGSPVKETRAWCYPKDSHCKFISFTCFNFSICRMVYSLCTCWLLSCFVPLFHSIFLSLFVYWYSFP